MSADNWTVCPKCNKRNVEMRTARKWAADESYGKVSVEEYRKIVDLAAQEIGIDSNLREDYEQFMDEDGVYTVSYRCACSVCDFSFRYTHKEKVEL